jgi:hypothetical protein
MRYPEPPSPPPANEDDDRPDTRKPPVPPDQLPDVIPQRDPPSPGHRKQPPLIADRIKRVPALAPRAAVR